MTEEKKETKGDTITIKKDALWKYSTFVLAGILVLGLIFFVLPEKSTTGAVVGTNNPTPKAPPSSGVTESQTSIDDDPILGNINAPVTIIEFSDYQCPFCRKFWTETLPLIKSEYIDTGKVKLVYRDYPIPGLGHAAAFPAAEAAECVRDQGGDEAYFKMHDKLFEEQNILDSGDPQGPVGRTIQFTADDIKTWAQEIGYDVAGCMDSGKFRNEVQKDLSDGGQLGTPTFFINGKKLGGAQPFGAFKQVIDAELAR